ncbi:MAG: alkaline phosphatase D family protein, partial [Blastopirellula sp. JB062]
MPPLRRRTFLLSTAALPLMPGIAQADAGATFTHGVASGDPDSQSVVIWTRLVPHDAEVESLELMWEVALDNAFTSSVKSGVAICRRENDYCVKLIVDGLEPGGRYYYRFSHGGEVSRIGRTQTLPKSTDRVRIGVANCAKYVGGYYHAYDALAQEDDLDVVIHLGDYIYENGAALPGDSYYPASQATGRQHAPPRHCVSLEDYRTRYAQYRGDEKLLDLHARYPMIVIWDDHDIAKIPKRSDQQGRPIYDAQWRSRFDASLKAWHEWIPSRVLPSEPIYRSFQFGDLVNLLMIDTRVCCKSEVTKTQASLRDPSRHIVGN